MDRPKDLPDFSAPPINEVVLGVQFAPIPGYQQIHAGEVWHLFKKDFPIVEEHPALPPTLENFGVRASQFNFDFVNGAMHDRFWFLTPEKYELIQYQQDKFLHNWRKVGDEKNEYPRFEKIISKYSKELKSLETYFQANFSSPPISVNQCEISYINFIYEVDTQGLSLNDIFSFLSFKNQPPEFACSFSDYILNDHGQPRGRINCSIDQALGPRGPMYRLTLSAKGAPKGNSINDALLFMKEGRERIVHLFKNLTGEPAHKLWGLK